jgi:hypothetical protein
MCVYVCVRVCVCACACVRVCARVRVHVRGCLRIHTCGYQDVLNAPNRSPLSCRFHRAHDASPSRSRRLTIVNIDLQVRTRRIRLGPAAVDEIRHGSAALPRWGLPVGAIAPTSAAERAALVDLYLATNGGGWSDRAGWVNYPTASVDPCDAAWSGVVCSGSIGSANRKV